MTSDGGYAHPEHLVDPAWLQAHLNDAGLVIVEVGAQPDSFAAGHIPGAIACADWHIKDRANPALVAPPAEAAALLEALGIGDDTRVIAYDRTRNRDASRLWWVLRYYGHTDVQVLDGGWKHWGIAGGPVEQGAGNAPRTGARFTPRVDAAHLCTVDSLKAAIGDGRSVIWDARGEDEFTGANDRGNKRRGHVPGARHLEWTHLVNEADHTFKPAAELKELAASIGISPETPVHVY